MKHETVFLSFVLHLSPPVQLCFSVLFQITIEAMKSDIDEVALQGIEFWSNVCDEEMDLAIEASEVCGAQSSLTTFTGVTCFADDPSLISITGLRTGTPPGAHQ